eukprot:75506_1
MGAVPNKPQTERTSNSIKTVSNQFKSPTCFAHATATAIVEARKHYDGTTLSHKHLVAKIVDKHLLPDGRGGHVSEVLKWQSRRCSYMDECQIYKISLVKRVLSSKRVIVASFSLNQMQRANLFAFYRTYPSTHVIEKSDINKKRNDYQGIQFKRAKKDIDGHAVVITGSGRCDEGLYWIVKNSWGNNYADKGYFRMMHNAFGKMRYYILYDDSMENSHEQLLKDILIDHILTNQ